MTDAILVMESRGLVPGSRSFTISDVWTRLYKTDEHFLDVSYKGKEQLMGQLLESSGEEAPGGGMVVVHDASNRELARTQLGDSGAFNLQVKPVPGTSLSIELANEQFKVADFNL